MRATNRSPHRAESYDVIDHGHAPELLRDLADGILTQQLIVCKIVVANDNRGWTVGFNAAAYVSRERVQVVASAHRRTSGSSDNKPAIMQLLYSQHFVVTIVKESDGEDAAFGVAHFDKQTSIHFKPPIHNTKGSVLLKTRVPTCHAACAPGPDIRSFDALLPLLALPAAEVKTEFARACSVLRCDELSLPRTLGCRGSLAARRPLRTTAHVLPDSGSQRWPQGRCRRQRGEARRGEARRGEARESPGQKRVAQR